MATQTLSFTPEGICDAAKAGDLNRVRQLLAAAPRLVHASNPFHGRKPLHYAAREGHAPVVQTLLDAGADLNETVYPNREITHPLTLARERGRTETVRVMEDWIALHAPQTASALGADLCQAIRTGDTERVRRILDADPSAIHQTDSSGNTALHAAAQEGNRPLAAQLLRLGAAPDPKNEAGLRPIHFALNKPLFSNEPFDLATADLLLGHGAAWDVWVASALGNGDILLEHGFDPNLRSQENTTLLHRTMGCMWRGHWCNSEEVMTVFSRVLADHGADLNAKDDDLRSTPLAWHARYGHAKVVEYLLSRGAATNLPDDEPWATPLAWAEKKGHREIADILRRHGTKA